MSVAVYSAEGEIRADVDLYRGTDLAKIWYNSFRKHVVEPWQKLAPAPDVSIITMHLSWYVKSHFFSPILSAYRNEVFQFLRDDFRPSNIFCLIDDIYRCQFRMLNGSVQFYFRLGEILRWRNIESLLADMLADEVVRGPLVRESSTNPFDRSPLIAINQPVSTLLRYVREPKLPRVYLSYPISEPKKAFARGELASMHETNDFRHYFLEKFTTFDPVTIDELPLKYVAEKYDASLLEEANQLVGSLFSQDLLSRTEEEGNKALKLRTFFSNSLLKDAKLAIREQDLWQRGNDEYDRSLISEKPMDIPSLSYQEVRGITIGGDSDDEHSELERQVRLRDLRLIDQSDCVITFRPTRGKDRWSDGTAAEAQYALDTRKRLFVIRDATDAPLRSPPFGQDLPEHNRIEESDLDRPDKRASVFQKVENIVRQRVKP